MPKLTKEELDACVSLMRDAGLERTADRILAHIDALTAELAQAEADNARLREALEQALSVLTLMERPSSPDPQYHAQVKRLGEQIGFGALMTTAEAGWREVLAEKGCPTGGEFCSGPCRAIVDKAILEARTALATPAPAPAKPDNTALVAKFKRLEEVYRTTQGEAYREARMELALFISGNKDRIIAALEGR